PERTNQGAHTLPSTGRGAASVGAICLRCGSGEPLQRAGFRPSRKRGGCVFLAEGCGAGRHGRRFTRALGTELMPGLSDTKYRRRALTDHTSTLLVEAGAGTGKTSLLAVRVALLLASGVHPRNVAAITFTELAA